MKSKRQSGLRLRSEQTVFFGSSELLWDFTFGENIKIFQKCTLVAPHVNITAVRFIALSITTGNMNVYSVPSGRAIWITFVTGE
jgi:hypothetical protein